MPTTLGIIASGFVYPSVTGGAVTSDAYFYYHRFNTNGNLIISNGSVAMTYFVVGGGGGGSTRSMVYPYQWQGYYGVHTCYAGGAGGAGSALATNLFSSTVTFAPQTITVAVGAGGGAFSNGSYCSIVSTPSISQNVNGGGAYNATPGENQDYQATGSLTVAPYGSPYQNSPYPYYYNGGGGAGAGSNSSNINGGTSRSLYIDYPYNGTSITFGGGGGGSTGGYDANDYNPNTFAFYYSTYPNNGGSGGGANAGDGSSTGNGGNATANSGSGGGAGLNTAGNGGSGFVIFRYTKAQVGG